MAQTDPATEAARAKFTGMRKAAMLMVILGEEVSAKLMKGLDEEEVHFIGREIARIPHMNSETAELILEEYYQMTIAHEYVLKGGVDYAKKILMNAFAPDHAQFLLARLMKTIGVDSANFDALQMPIPSSWPSSFTANIPKRSLSSSPT